MKWNISRNMCKLVELTHLKNWSIKIWKNVTVWIWDNPIYPWTEIWDYTLLNNRNQIYSSEENKVIIWKFCSIAYWVSFIANVFHDYNYLTTRMVKKSVWKTIKIGNDVWIWRNAIIMKWVNIWTWAVIGAWAVVTKDIPPYAIAVWNPAKVIKYRFNEKTIKKLLESKRWEWDINKIKDNYNLDFIRNSYSLK